MTTTPAPRYAPNVALTVQYLEACNKIFERGILGHVRIFSGDSIILSNMEEGYHFLCTWLDGLLKKKGNLTQHVLSIPLYIERNSCSFVLDLCDILCLAGFNSVDPKSKSFLAWKTWDLLRIMWQGFKLLCTNFTAQNPGYYVSPLRLNGSAVETLFSQLKFISHGDLSATRYPQAIASLITKGSIRGQRRRREL